MSKTVWLLSVTSFKEDSNVSVITETPFVTPTLKHATLAKPSVY